MQNLSQVAMPLLPDKNGTVLHDCIVPVIYEFTWNSALTETFKRHIPEGTKVQLQSYDCLQVDRTGIVAADFGKIISFAPHFDPEVNINPV